MVLNFKKLRKLRTNPKLFFKDAIEKKVFWLSGVYNKYLPKKHKGFTQYAIISAVYNVEKYLDDYFKSIINQRLHFKKNIFMILVDDGSTDNSAQIIKKYQKKYPKNIVYLYKENGGQASARNLGLKYMQENDYQIPWVTFTDPDDFLDRNYFYEVDKFLSAHQDDDICMIACNVIFYHKKQRIYKDNHSLNFKFKNGIQVIKNYNLDNFIQLSAASCFMNITLLNNLIFDEKLKPNFEDAKFINEYLLENINLKSAFLSKAKYFYRKREEGNSTLNLKLRSKDFFLIVPKYGYLKILHKNFSYSFICKLVLYDLYWHIVDLLNSPEKISILNENEKQEYLNLLDENFSYIESEVIMSFYIPNYNFFHKVGILNCFKNEKPSFQIAYIEDYDPYKEQILITYYTGDDKDVESIVVDGEEVYIDYKKIVKYDFLDRVFCYQKRLWVHIPKNAKDKLEMFINNEQSMVGRYGEYSLDIKSIRKEFQKRLPKSNIWLLMDRDYEADDNAEHLYRYIMQNHPEQEIVFALRKESSDWKRLEKERFNLIEFESFEFERIIKKASKVISSHADEYLIRHVTLTQQFVFVQHGVIMNDLSRWLNSKKINLFITSTRAEYDSIANNYNRYKFGKKEVLLTGLARHDVLLKNNKSDTKQILMMPTWRAGIVGNVTNSSKRELKENFKQSEYFQKWNSLLNNDSLKKLCELYSYTIVFNPHPNIMPYLKEFNLPSYIKIANQDESLQVLFCNSSLMITDYSSVAFEMAYLEKPVIYYQFDKEDFFNSHTLQKGYFDYTKDGFGPVVENEENLLKELESLLQNDCKSFGVYKDNIDSAFVFKDRKCCERIYKKLNPI
ncbi:TPA: CDP-glycerol glycerophosphotransferase family protein [Campylobacter coli]|nr:glycosyltransferase [Campylobacter coli]HDZ5240852.1 CDP-glycerol glycerophosphotransferase family protein [Campylobacter coli]HDZ5249882.1 CDP-glycerol glycerophosphotransferase family protein [Campylobacter coli]HED0417581.1 CDP-glycerol glycerophosphotransferase family protein [Campylobacter coli]HED0435257.1 CDP-glycerol glycerophosphotransferase family protein [Campylobacter coli]